ncbi:MAG: hypothetical protein GKC05_00810 [Methanomicrobiales archaeon]|nr:hypothetical protein [Methanomicrobiales archaeon]NYT20569.1 hypothetical protein [Methanomicrobiales archaeon]
MGAHKHIERTIGAWIASRYRSAAEIGVGSNTTAAGVIAAAGGNVICTDIRQPGGSSGVPIVIDDIFSPDMTLYDGIEVIYAIRPAEEMMPALIALARRLDCDLIVYHLGFEGYGNGGEIIDCGVTLHQYHRGQKPSKSVF